MRFVLFWLTKRLIIGAIVAVAIWAEGTHIQECYLRWFAWLKPDINCAQNEMAFFPRPLDDKQLVLDQNHCVEKSPDHQNNK